MSMNCVDEPLAALKSFSKESDLKMQRSDAQSQRRRLALAFSDKALLAKMLFLKKAPDLLAAFQNLFKREKPLLHVMHSELLSLVWWVLSHALRAEVIVRSTEGLKKLDLDGPTIWKTLPEVGPDTEKAMKMWDAAEKKEFRLGAISLYLACFKSLLRTLPLDNKVIFHA